MLASSRSVEHSDNESKSSLSWRSISSPETFTSLSLSLKSESVTVMASSSVEDTGVL